MAAGARSNAEFESGTEGREPPEISLCESSPGKAVFLESGNTDGWIASDLTVDVTR